MISHEIMKQPGVKKVVLSCCMIDEGYQYFCQLSFKA